MWIKEYADPSFALGVKTGESRSGRAGKAVRMEVIKGWHSFIESEEVERRGGYQ